MAMTLFAMRFRTTDDRIDEALEESFPASDPPAFIGAGALPGPAPKPRKPRNEWGLDFGATSYLAIRH
jgi:hypothetical protein